MRGHSTLRIEGRQGAQGTLSYEKSEKLYPHPVAAMDQYFAEMPIKSVACQLCVAGTFPPSEKFKLYFPGK